jgi:hypothetical protein
VKAWGGRWAGEFVNRESMEEFREWERLDVDVVREQI